MLNHIQSRIPTGLERAFDQGEVSPFSVMSPQKEQGKIRVQEVIFICREHLWEHMVQSFLSSRKDQAHSNSNALLALPERGIAWKMMACLVICWNCFTLHAFYLILVKNSYFCLSGKFQKIGLPSFHPSSCAKVSHLIWKWDCGVSNFGWTFPSIERPQSFSCSFGKLLPFQILRIYLLNNVLLKKKKKKHPGFNVSQDCLELLILHSVLLPIHFGTLW